MRRKIPSTAALAAFEAAARHMSFTRAADELAVTQSAVCRQVATLEDYVGVKLFRRSRRGVLLTEAGQAYAANVRQRLDEVERDTLALMAQGAGGGALELGVVPTFATKWLLPRLPRFVAQHPGITLHLTPRTRPFVFEDTHLDATLHTGEAGWPGTESTPLLAEQMVAVANPEVAARLARQTGGAGVRRKVSPQAIASAPLLQMATRPYAWRQWFASLGLQVAGDLAGQRMELYSLITAAAIQGLGVALVPRMLIEEELHGGQLKELLQHAHLSDRRVQLIVPESKTHLPAVVALRAWLLEESRAYAAQQGARGPAGPGA
jgi:LysR family glycine cleavage system transcriptional activator